MMHHHKSFLKQRWTGACLSLLATCAIFLANIPAQSQDKKQTKSAEDDVVKINSNLVSLDVIVKDKKDRKSTRLNSSHDQISYAVFCLKKKNKNSDPASYL